MWNSSIKIDYIAGMIVQAIEQFSINGSFNTFSIVLDELRKNFPNCSEQEIADIIRLCIEVYNSKTEEKMELVITAPDSFKIKTRKTKEVISDLIINAKKSITMTGYSVSDYFSEMMDIIIDKSQRGIYVRMYINDIKNQKILFERPMAYQNRYLQIYEYQRSDDDKMAASHAKIIVVDSEKALVSSANLSYHGLASNIEMGTLIFSKKKAEQIENLLKELKRMKVFG